MSQERTQRAYALVRELDHPRPEVRRSAADELVAIGLDAEPALSEAVLVERDIKVRRRILLVLRELKAPKAIPALLEYVLSRPADAPDDTRALALRAAVDALQPRHARHVFDTFVQLRRDPDTLVRSIVLEGLARLGDPRAVRFLEEAARSTDSDELVRDTATRLLTSFTESTDEDRGNEQIYTREDLVFKLASRDAFQREMAIDELVARDPAAYDAFVEAVRSAHDLARQSGIIGLGRLGDPRAAQMLIRMIEHETTHDHDRALAMRAIANIPLPDPVDREVWLRQLERFLRSEDVFVVGAALQAIAAVHHPDALDLVASRLRSKQPWLRDSAAEALAASARSHDKSLLTPLADALADSARRSRERRTVEGDWPADEARLQISLLTALNRVAEPGSGAERGIAATVVRYLAHPHHELRREAHAFLDAVARKPGDLAEPTLKILLETTGSQRAGARDAALDLLERTLPEPSPWAAPALARLTWDTDERVVMRAIELLGRTGDSDEATQALGRLAQDPRKAIAGAARDALMRQSGTTLQ